MINMNAKKGRSYSRHTKDAAILLGKHIQLGRKERGLTEIDLADRAGISRATLQKIEKGDPKCELGLFFEVAILVGVRLFDVDSTASFSTNLDRVNDKIALLPKSVRKKKKEIDDAF
jgi:DNA-binding XRE family transcriptional regulator